MPRPGSPVVGTFQVDAFVPELLVNAPQPTPAQLVAAADIEARIRSMQGNAEQEVQFDGVARMLLRAEAVSSSRIEGLGMGHRRLARAEAGRHDMDAAAVVDNVRAAVEAVERAKNGRDLTADEVCSIHERLVHSDPRMLRHTGRFRQEQNWIGGNPATPEGAEFIPPPWFRVEELMEDLCTFAARTDVLTSIQAATLHAQFETIHPFADGNGRVGRILIVTQLARRGTASSAIPPISLALVGMADKYMQGLTSWRFGDPADWFAVFLDALATATDAVQGLRVSLDALIEGWFEALDRPRRHSALARLLRFLPSHPVLNVHEAMLLTGQSEAAVRRAMRRLHEAGIVKPLNIGVGKTGWEVIGVFQLLDDLERGTGELKRAPRPTN